MVATFKWKRKSYKLSSSFWKIHLEFQRNIVWKKQKPCFQQFGKKDREVIHLENLLLSVQLTAWWEKAAASSTVPDVQSVEGKKYRCCFYSLLRRNTTSMFYQNKLTRSNMLSRNKENSSYFGLQTLTAAAGRLRIWHSNREVNVKPLSKVIN